MRDRVFADVGRDWSRFDQDDLDICVAHFHAQHIGQPFEREFRGHIGAAPFQSDQPQHARAIDDPPVPLGAHDGDHEVGELVTTEHIDLEDFAQCPARQVLDRPGQA